MCKRFKKLAAKTMAAITTITLSITALLPSFASAAGDQFDTDGDFLTSGFSHRSRQHPRSGHQRRQRRLVPESGQIRYF